jgi:hypothetical protein
VHKHGAHKVVDLLASLLVGEPHAVISLHDAIASPLTHSAAEIRFVARAHWTFPTEGLQQRMDFWDLHCSDSAL